MKFIPALLILVSAGLFSNQDHNDILKNYSGRQKYEKMISMADSVYAYNDSIAENYLSEAMEYAGKNEDPVTMMKARHVKGNILYHTGNNRNAAEEYKNSLILAEKLNDRIYLYENCKQLGRIFYFLAEYKTSAIFLYKARDIAQSLGDELKEADIYNVLGIVFDELEEFSKAEECYNRAIIVYEKYKIPKDIAKTYNNIATSRFNQRDFENAYSTFEKALNLYSMEKDDHKIAVILNNMASIDIERMKYDEAISRLKTSEKIFKEISDNYGIALNDHKFGRAYFFKKNYQTAVKYFDKSAKSASEMEVPALVRDNYFYKSKIDSAVGDYKSAYSSFKRFVEVNNAISSETKQKEIQDITAKYELAQKEKQNFSLIRDNEIKRLQLDKQKQINNFFIILFILMAGVSYFAYRSYVLKSKNEELLRNYSNEIERLNLKLAEEIEKTKNELNESNEKLRKTEKESARTDKLVTLGTMVAGITHEIKNPAQVIKLSMDNIRLCMNDLALFIYDLMKLNRDNKAGASDIKDLVEKHRVVKLFNDIKGLIVSNKRSVELIDQIVSSTSKITHFNRQTKENLINDIIQDVLVIMKNSLKYSATVELDLDPKLPAVKCNYQEIAQILINLLTNARDAIKEKQLDQGEGIIRVKTGSENEKMFIEVSDNGVGIKDENTEKAFEAFFTTKQEGEGQGLGLSIVKSIVDIYGGFITLNTKAGEGTSFRIYFPINGIDDKSNYGVIENV